MLGETLRKEFWLLYKYIQLTLDWAHRKRWSLLQLMQLIRFQNLCYLLCACLHLYAIQLFAKIGTECTASSASSSAPRSVTWSWASSEPTSSGWRTRARRGGGEAPTRAAQWQTRKISQTWTNIPSEKSLREPWRESEPLKAKAARFSL